MASSPMRIYWDSCVFISFLQKDSERYEKLVQIMGLAVDKKIVFIASALVIAEVVRLDSLQANVNIAPEKLERDAKTIREFFSHEFIKVRSVDRKIAEDSQELARQHKLRPNDAIHIATAISYNCDAFQTYDGEQGCKSRLLAHDGKFGNPPLRIEVPKLPGCFSQMKLPAVLS